MFILDTRSNMLNKFMGNCPKLALLRFIKSYLLYKINTATLYLFVFYLIRKQKVCFPYRGTHYYYTLLYMYSSLVYA